VTHPAAKLAAEFARAVEHPMLNAITPDQVEEVIVLLE
jgi:hypothetical protein